MGTVLIALFGILLPIVALSIELHTGMCAEVFFDPIPTLGHIGLVALVPLGNLLTLIVAKGGWTSWRTPLLWLNAVVLGVATFYTLVYMPIMPLATIAILAYGMGLLPLTPILSLLCAIALRVRLVRMADKTIEDTDERTVKPRFKTVSLVAGAALGVALLLAMEGRVALTLLGAEMAADDTANRQLRGIRLLRAVGDTDELLRMCYRDGTRGFGMFSRGHSVAMCGYLFNGVPRAEAQQVYFRVTGTPYNSVPPPRGSGRILFDEFDFDPDVGGEAVAGRRKNLSLISSRIDARVHGDAATAGFEWTMTFRNDHSQQAEARAQVLLPPGGVASNATLWVNGEPRKAAVAKTAQVRAAYKRVAVQQRRDPLLVTWAGTDRVLVQCFPVPPGGEMQVRLSITAPLVLTKADTAVLRLPCFAERNFNAAREVHSVWIEADRPCPNAPKPLRQEQAMEAKHVLSGSLTDEQLSSAKCSIAISRAADASRCSVAAPSDLKKHVLQEIVADRPVAKSKIVLVIDGSRDMGKYLSEVAEAIGAAKYAGETRVLLAADEVVDLSEAVSKGGGAQALASRFQDLAGKGGCDNVSALLRAVEEAGSDRTIVWIHGPQPVILLPPTPLLQRLENGPDIMIHDLAIGSGANRLAEQLGPLHCLHTVPRMGSPGDDLRRLLDHLSGKDIEYRFVRTLTDKPPANTPIATADLARLWAAGEVETLARRGTPVKRAAAVKLAADYHLVTAVSGAVVLENKQQYDEAGLRAPDEEATTDAPEPAVWIMLLAVLPCLLWRLWRRRHHNR